MELDIFSDYNFRMVLVGTGLLGLTCGAVGAFAVLRQKALLSDVVAHAALPGVCVAFLLSTSRSLSVLLLGALAGGVIASLLVSLLSSITKLKHDALLAFSLGTFFGGGLVLSRIIQNHPLGNKAGLDTFIFGKAASIVSNDIILISAVSLISLTIIIVLFKELLVVSFDREFARSAGLPVRRIEALLAVMTAVVTVCGLPAVGVVLMVALIVIPGASARFWTDRAVYMIPLAAFFGLCSGTLGTVLSSLLPAPSSGISKGWPTGPLITIVAGSIFLVSAFVGSARGILWKGARARIADDTLEHSGSVALKKGSPDGD